MAAPALIPLTLFREDTAPAVIWGFDVAPDEPADLTGSEFRLEVSWYRTGGSYVRTTEPQGGLTVNLVAGNVKWNLREEDTTLVPLGKKAHYKLKRIIDGEAQTWIYGPLTIEDGWDE